MTWTHDSGRSAGPDEAVRHDEAIGSDEAVVPEEAVGSDEGVGFDRPDQPRTSAGRPVVDVDGSGSFGIEQDVVGVGPHPHPWPDDDRLDPELLAEGDRRNVVDRYRYWSNEAIVADLDRRRHPFHVAIENWQHDRNIGTIVRTANAFLAAEIHIVGKRRWNRRGAMVTDRYQHIRYHRTIDDLVEWAACVGIPIVGIDLVPGSVPIEAVEMPTRCLLLFGQEGPGLSTSARQACSMICSISQFGSTRSINVGVAAGIAMHAWIRAHADL